MSRAVLPAMIGAGGGSIIHIASQLGSVAASRRAAYCATGALIQLAKAMATDHASQNIRSTRCHLGGRNRATSSASATWKRRGARRAPHCKGWSAGGNARAAVFLARMHLVS
jgi:NAD(P)-dependent dehydrogenase (short-subunit alcohol dehydrogenase family)